MDGYLLCFVPRSGSTWLCDMLCHTHKLGYPTEAFNPKKVKEALDSGRFDKTNDYLAHVLQDGCSENGIWGAKVTWHHIQFLLQFGLPHEVLGVRLHYIWLDREDRHAQVISDYKAMTENYFHSTMPRGDVRASYDSEKILQVQTYLDSERASFLDWFKTNEIHPALSLTYEQLERNPEHFVREIGSWYGVEPGSLKWRLNKLETMDDEIWKIAYRRDLDAGRVS